MRVSQTGDATGCSTRPRAGGSGMPRRVILQVSSSLVRPATRRLQHQVDPLGLVIGNRHGRDLSPTGGRIFALTRRCGSRRPSSWQASAFRLLHIFVARRGRLAAHLQLPPCPAPEHRTLFWCCASSTRGPHRAAQANRPGWSFESTALGAGARTPPRCPKCSVAIRRGGPPPKHDTRVPFVKDDGCHGN